MFKKRSKGFTILELLVVVAIIAILAIIAIPNFIGRIDDAKASQNLAEINAVEKAIATYYADNGVYPTLQGKDGAILQAQPLEGSPHNIDFSMLVPNYLASLPNFSYWWVDYQGSVYHTEKSIGALAGSVFTPTTGYTYTLYKANGTTQVLSGPYTLLAGEYIVGKDDTGSELPKIGLAFKNEKMHPEDPDYVASIPVTGVTLNKTTLSIMQGSNEMLAANVAPSNATNTAVTWTSSNTSVATVDSIGKVVAVSTGTSIITVRTADGNRTATCAVTVTAPFTSQTFNFNGAAQTFIVPTTGTYKLEVYGAQGGPLVKESGYGVGGKGGYSVGNKLLTAGNTLYIYVGQGGTRSISSTFNGGGSGSSGNGGLSGQGGGASDVRINGSAFVNRVIVAGGGGGGGGNLAFGDSCSSNGGAGGGLAGVTGESSYGDTSYRAGGTGGTQTAGGTVASPGTSGSLGQGGYAVAGPDAIQAGGGGGGYYGGASGKNGGGAGGGGSGYIGGVTGGSMSAGVQTGNGQVIITYVGP